MATPEKPQRTSTTRGLKELETSLEPVKQKQQEDEALTLELIQLLEGAEALFQGITIESEDVLKEHLSKLVQGTSFAGAILQSRKEAPQTMDKKVVAGQIKMFGTYRSDGCYNVWFERGQQGQWILAYNKVSKNGNTRERSVTRGE